MVPDAAEQARLRCAAAARLAQLPQTCKQAPTLVIVAAAAGFAIPSKQLVFSCAVSRRPHYKPWQTPNRQPTAAPDLGESLRDELAAKAVLVQFGGVPGLHARVIKAEPAAGGGAVLQGRQGGGARGKEGNGGWLVGAPLLSSVIGTEPAGVGLLNRQILTAAPQSVP